MLDIVVHKEQAGELYKAISRLDMKYRTMIVYYYYNQMSTREIAAACNCLEGTVKSRLFTARGQLKKHLMKAEQEVSQYEESEQYGYANQPRTAQ